MPGPKTTEPVRSPTGSGARRRASFATAACARALRQSPSPSPIGAVGLPRFLASAPHESHSGARSGAEPVRGVAGGRCGAPSSRSRSFRAASKSRALAPLNIPTAPYRVANRACLAPGHQRKQAAATGAGQLAISLTARQGPTIGMTVGHMTIAATNIAARLRLLLRAQHPSA